VIKAAKNRRFFAALITGFHFETAFSFSRKVRDDTYMQAIAMYATIKMSPSVPYLKDVSRREYVGSVIRRKMVIQT
jgi:hypothetical protein